MIVRREPPELSVEDLDRELIAKGAQLPREELFTFKDRKGTAARADIMARVKELYDTAPSPSPHEEFDLIGIRELVVTLIHKTGQIEENRNRGIWYDDHRMDYFGIPDEKIKKNADAVAAVMLKDNLLDLKNGRSKLKVKNYGDVFNLWENEPFREQPVSIGPLCTGFLVSKDIIAAAAHFVNENNVTHLRIVFGYRMSSPDSPVIQIPGENIYTGVEVIHRLYRRLDLMSDGTDFALVRLDREVRDREVVVLSKGEVVCQQPVYVIGHPAGLPLKYAPGARVRDLKTAYFAADLDIYMGNSGSPVFAAETHEVVGMVVRGDTRDFRWTGNGWASVIYPHREIKSSEPQCTKVSQFSPLCP